PSARVNLMPTAHWGLHRSQISSEPIKSGPLLGRFWCSMMWCLNILCGATMRPRMYLAIIALVVPVIASAQQFNPSMVEVGEVSPQAPHVTFDPPFPSTPKVVLSIKDQNVGGTYRGCGVEAKNVTATGFDYFAACSARRPGGPLPVPVNLIAIWIATLQQ